MFMQKQNNNSEGQLTTKLNWWLFSGLVSDFREKFTESKPYLSKVNLTLIQ